MTLVKFIAEPVFDVSLFLNARLYIIQLYKLIKTKNADNISLSTFVLFFFILLVQALQAYYLSDYGYFIGMIASLIASSSLILFILYYRFKRRLKIQA